MEIDLSNLDFATCQKMDEIFRKDYELKILKAIRRQTRLAAINCRGERSRNSFGPRMMEMDPVIDAHWRQCYGHDYTENQDLMKFLLKRNPEIGVKTTGTKIQVGYGTCGQGTKFSKRYPTTTQTPILS